MAIEETRPVLSEAAVEEIIEKCAAIAESYRVSLAPTSAYDRGRNAASIDIATAIRSLLTAQQDALEEVRKEWDDLARMIQGYREEAAEMRIERCRADARAEAAEAALAEMRRENEALKGERVALVSVNDRFALNLDVMRQRAETAQSQLAEKDREIERLSKFADFVLMWADRGPPHGGPGNEATVLDAIRHHPILSTRRASLHPKGESNTTAPKLNGPPTGVVDYSGLTKPKGESND